MKLLYLYYQLHCKKRHFDELKAQRRLIYCKSTDIDCVPQLLKQCYVFNILKGTVLNIAFTGRK